MPRDDDLARVVGQVVATVRRHHDGVADAPAKAAVQADPAINGEGHARLQDGGVPGLQLRRLQVRHADGATGPVAGDIATLAVDGVGGLRHGLRRHARADRGDCRLLCVDGGLLHAGGIIGHLIDKEHAVEAELVELELRHVAEAEIDRITDCQWLHAGSAMHHRGVAARLHDLQIVDHGGNEGLPPARGQEPGSFPRARIDDGQRGLVLRRTCGQRPLRRRHHRPGDLPRLAHDADLFRRLDHPHRSQHRCNIGQACVWQTAVEPVAHDGRQGRGLHRNRPVPVPQNPRQHCLPAIDARVFPGLDPADPGHGAHHLAFHQRGDNSRLLIRADDQERRATELHREVAPEPGQPGNRAFIGQDGEFDPFLPHPLLKRGCPLACLLQHRCTSL